ncbi:MAG: hypothetical protein AB7Q45_23975 [Planctomycetaceae bacterium]
MAREPAVDQSASKADVRFFLEANSRFGLFTYVPEHWGELHLRLEHAGDTPRELLCTSYFDGQPTLQFGRQVWLPPRSKLSISHPVFFPPADYFQDETANVQSLLIENTPGEEVLVKNDAGQLRHDRSLLVRPAVRNTGVAAGWSSADAVPQDVLDLIVASRVNQGLSNKVTVLAGQFLPADETSLNYLDHLVLAENRLVDDVAALTAVRRWLHAGGRLWIMLDRADPVILERLLGDEFQGYVVDRVGLTSVRIDNAPSLLVPNGEPGETIDYEEPVPMARMVVSGMRVWNSVNGWPAALTRAYGEGRLLITTLGPRAWIKPTPPPGQSQPAERQPNSESDFAPVSPMVDLAAYILGQREPAALPQGELEDLVQEYVSYQIPNWSLIVGTMGCLLASLIATGIWLWRWERLEYFGWSGSLLGVIFGLLLFGFGLANRYRVPATIASVQLVQAISGTDDVRARGLIAVYRPEGSPSLIRTAQGGELWPEMTGLEGSTRRMVTTDLGKFHWEGLPQPAGLRFYPDATSRAFDERIAARATMDAQGIVGTLAGHLAAGADVVLATRQGRIGVQWAADGAWTARADEVLEADQYLDATFLGDVQNRRRRIVKELYENRSWRNSLDRPQLLLWLNDWDHGFRFGDGLARQGETLLTVPLEISRPPTGTEMLIPSPLLGFVSRRPPDGSAPSGFWDEVRGEWQERSSPSSTWLSFQIPRGLLPLRATQARLEVKVSGLMGRIEIMGVRDGEVVSLESVQDPVGSLVFELDDPEILTVSANGELTLGVSAGVSARPVRSQTESAAVASSDAAGSTPQAAAGLVSTAPANYWRIESLSMQLWARASELPEED